MRINFPNSTRPKKAAKAVSVATGQSLAACQQAIAKACGYRDWHDLETSFSSTNEPPNVNIIESEIALVKELVQSLDANAGDVQYALSTSRLTGNRPADPRQSLEIRRRLFEAAELPPAGRRERGAIGKLKSAGRNGEHVILRSFGRSTRVITHKSADAIVSDFEFVTPRVALPLFIPMRLYIPYGSWTEPDGSIVVFSRDYFPMWRLRVGRTPERLDPWLRIEHDDKDDVWFWDDRKTPWSEPKNYEREMERLAEFGIFGMPKLVEVLPIVAQRDDVKDFKNAVPILEEVKLYQPP